MTDLPSDFKTLLPPHEAVATRPYDGPIYWLWTFDPIHDRVTITHNEDRPRALAATHDDLAPEVTHPGRIDGYAYKIQGGYRITNDEHRKIDDPHIVQLVRRALIEEKADDD